MMAQQTRIEVAQTIRAQRQALAEQVVARQYAQRPERWRAYGDVGREKSVRDVCYHLDYLSEAIRAEDPALFAEYVAWVRTLFASLGFADNVLVRTLQCMRDVLHETLPSESMALAYPYLETGLRQARAAPVTPPTYLPDDAPLSQLARAYLDALLQGERHVASRLILDAVENHANLKDIYLHVFQPTQREVGRLWQMNRVSVAQEHYCTAVTQLVMSQLYPYIFATERRGRRLVATCVGGELHEIGVRMVADFFEMEGWDTYYLGANTPAASIQQTLVERRADVLAISATMTFHVSAVAELISLVRGAHNANPRVSILVGGYPFLVAPDLWRELGADGHARDAREAVTVAEALVAEREG
jgi:methanogenic corrinoid protein MtbC1